MIKEYNHTMKKIMLLCAAMLASVATPHPCAVKLTE